VTDVAAAPTSGSAPYTKIKLYIPQYADSTGGTASNFQYSEYPIIITTEGSSADAGYINGIQLFEQNVVYNVSIATFQTNANDPATPVDFAYLTYEVDTDKIPYAINA
jgi:hypothetical protein